MGTVKYNFDETFTVKNKVTGNKFINNVKDKKIYIAQAGTGRKSLLADFCITDLVWNDSSKDIDNIKLNGTGGSTDYAIGTNATALKNRIFKESYIARGQVLPSSTDKKFQQFAVNELLYEMILTLVYKIQDESLPVGAEEVLISYATSDTEELQDAVITFAVTDEGGAGVKDIHITGNVGSVEVDETTDNNGQATVTLEAVGTYLVAVQTEATEKYKAAEKAGSVTVTEVENEPEPAGEGQ